MSSNTELLELSANDLAHVPSLPQSLILGHTLQIIRDPLDFNRRNIAAFGEIFRVRFLGKWRVQFVSAEGLEFVLNDTDKVFSSSRGWFSIAEFFSGGLMLRDFDDHRSHRRIMQSAFKKPAMDSYFEMMVPAMSGLVANWPVNKTIKFYPAIKDLTLRLGARVFMGLPVETDGAKSLSKDFKNEVAASLAILRTRIPFTRYRRGLDARVRLSKSFTDLIRERRNGDGQDFFSQMCRVTDDEGKGWTDKEIVDHFNFLMMAAHDTTASALTAMIWALTEHPVWQERLAHEVVALGDGQLTIEMLDHMPLTEMVFKEALRFIPPVPLIPRQAIQGFSFGGHEFPRGTNVTANVGGVMMSPRHFTDPLKFDPDRFSPERAEDRSHKFAWAPFGGGAHKCIGMHFSSMQVKIFVHALLSRFTVTREGKVPIEWARLRSHSLRAAFPYASSRGAKHLGSKQQPRSILVRGTHRRSRAQARVLAWLDKVRAYLRQRGPRHSRGPRRLVRLHSGSSAHSPRAFAKATATDASSATNHRAAT